MLGLPLIFSFFNRSPNGGCLNYYRDCPQDKIVIVPNNNGTEVSSRAKGFILGHVVSSNISPLIKIATSFILIMINIDFHN